jgi:helix-turn-helix protein
MEVGNMAVISQNRASDSPFVEGVWQVQAVSDGCDTVTADVSWDMLIMTQDGKTSVSIWGPMTQTARIPHKQGDSCLGIRFKLGTFMPHLSADKLLNQGMTLPEATAKSFWLGSAAWELPAYENVETFVAWLARLDLLARDPLVDAVLQGQPNDASLRSVQRHFTRTTGLTPSYVRYIERAQQAAALLEKGIPILDVVYDLDYTDQSHLTKSLKRLVGQTPAQILMKPE